MILPASDPTHATPSRPSFQGELSAALAAAAAALLLLSPLAALTLAAFLLINLPARTPRLARVMLGVAVAVALAMLAGNRPIDPDIDSNDINGYYESYQNLAAGLEGAFDTQFGAGMEVALPLLMALLGGLLPPLTPNGLMFCFALTGSLLMFAWVEMGSCRRTGRPNLALMGICLIMLNLYFATQLSRQFLSLVVLLFAFTATSRIRQGMWLLVSASFHLTALPFFGIYWLAKRGWIGWLLLVAAAVVFRMSFATLLVALDVLPEALVQKLLYYADDLDPTDAADLTSLRMVGLLAMISIGVLISCRFRPPAGAKPWLVAPWLTAIVYLVLLPVPLASLRTTLMVHSIAPGLIAFNMLTGRPRSLLLTVLNALAAYKVLSFSTQAPNLQSGFGMLSGFFL